MKPFLITLFIKNTKRNIIFSAIKKNLKNDSLLKEQTILLFIISCGQLKLRGKQKTTPFSLNILINKVFEKLILLGGTCVNIIFKGINKYKKVILYNIFKNKYFIDSRIQIISISEITNYIYNGCKQKKFKKY